MTSAFYNKQQNFKADYMKCFCCIALVTRSHFAVKLYIHSQWNGRSAIHWPHAVYQQRITKTYSINVALFCNGKCLQVYGAPAKMPVFSVAGMHTEGTTEEETCPTLGAQTNWVKILSSIIYQSIATGNTCIGVKHLYWSQTPVLESVLRQSSSFNLDADRF